MSKNIRNHCLKILFTPFSNGLSVIKIVQSKQCMFLDYLCYNLDLNPIFNPISTPNLNPKPNYRNLKIVTASWHYMKRVNLGAHC